jgi:hypothetical protein
MSRKCQVGNPFVERPCIFIYKSSLFINIVRFRALKMYQIMVVKSNLNYYYMYRSLKINRFRFRVCLISQTIARKSKSVC